MSKARVRPSPFRYQTAMPRVLFLDLTIPVARHSSSGHIKVRSVTTLTHGSTRNIDMSFRHLVGYQVAINAKRRHRKCAQCRSHRVVCTQCARMWCPYCHPKGCPALHVDTPFGTPIISIPINPPILSTPAPGATTRRPHRRTQPSTHRIELPPELQAPLKPLMSFLATQGWTLKAYNPDPSKTFDYILIGTMPILPDKAWEFFPQKLVDMYQMQPPQKYMKTVPPQLVVSVKLPKG